MVIREPHHMVETKPVQSLLTYALRLTIVLFGGKDEL